MFKISQVLFHQNDSITKGEATPNDLPPIIIGQIKQLTNNLVCLTKHNLILYTVMSSFVH